MRASWLTASTMARSVASRLVCGSFGTGRSVRPSAEESATSEVTRRRRYGGVGCRLVILHPMSMPVTATQADIKDSILDAIGHTPLVRLSRMAAGLTPQVIAKVEALNPGGSIKDRVAIA